MDRLVRMQRLGHNHLIRASSNIRSRCLTGRPTACRYFSFINWDSQLERSHKAVQRFLPSATNGLSGRLTCCASFHSSRYVDFESTKFSQADVRALLHDFGIPHTYRITKWLTDHIAWFRNSISNPQRSGGSNSGNENPKDQNEGDDKPPFVAQLLQYFVFSFIIFASLQFLMQSGKSVSYISWNEFVTEMLAKGEVESIVNQPGSDLLQINLHRGAIIRGKRAETNVFYLRVPDANFEQKIRQIESELGIPPAKGVSITYSREQWWLPLVLMGVLFGFIYLNLRYLSKNIQMPSSLDSFTNFGKAKYVRGDMMTAQRPVGFKDVAGLHEAKVEVMEFVDYLKRPDKYQSLGAHIPRGALLTGPPGCGKTLLAKAVSTEAKVPFLAMAGSDFVEMIGGLGAARVRDLFKDARQKAPCIIYIDEIDAIGRNRSGDSGNVGDREGEQTLNQLLVEMDGMGSTQGVIMLASTNRGHVLDKALLRPGRFDRHIQIDLPTLKEREEIFEIYLKRLRLKEPVSSYSHNLAQYSPGMNGAEIANICNEAALHAARDQKKAVEAADFDYAVERVVAGVAKKSRVLSPKEKKVVAYHEAGHAVVGWLLKETDALMKVTIVPRTSAALGFAQYLPQDRLLHSKEELFERMCMALGGRVAESLTFNSATSGAQDDLKRVTDIAYTQIRQMGMNDNVGHVSFPTQEEAGVGKRPYSKRLSALMDIEARNLVAQAYKTAEQILSTHQEKLRVVAEALLEKETLTYVDMEELIGPPLYKKNIAPAPWGSPTSSPQATNT